MKVWLRSLFAIFITLTVLWWLTDPSEVFTARGFFVWRNLMVRYSGVLGMGAMSAAMILAIRPIWLENHFVGLDKIYCLHKWLGIAGLILSIIHWLTAKGPKWVSPARFARQTCSRQT
jgi:predicted ferric reductase